MASALRLAERGLFTTQPNPRVGCVIAQGEQAVGSGWHERAGGAHAEVVALNEAGERARGGTAYVTLEPCAHFGRTPPCADALISAGVARVVIAHGDPFGEVSGRGIRRLREAGITVETGLMSEPARELNRGFFARIERSRPWLRVKLAMSMDGRTALSSGESRWITGEAARADVQRWRARSSAILTGVGTILADDPALTVRDPLCKAPVAPVRVILDRHLRTPPGSRVLDGSAPSLVFHGPDAKPVDARFEQVERHALELSSERLDLTAMLAELARRDINEIQVEAGPTLCGALFAQDLVDELLLYVAPVLLGDAARPLMNLPALADMSERWKLETIDQRTVGSDWRLLLRSREN
ncbi:bifunctional diaminohydroxyphosphoribosylaminopyrimidine deaminase/5-amino-6-(5-phosphoribosylamino)uracil reductase RibD [Dokdonella sp.]|uniref:bifunctional diaminohydroxyphosphoribosylaminopyrimidine deaminase/5-amino-6-(5-phosphoribosylamino)uracil reductase RibD n=1 Tax=Dokdonella sp. TaxID=2291710 RepID=UPI0035283716